MEIYPMSASPGAGLSDGLERLIETVATSQFHRELLRVAQSIAGSLHITAFSVDRQGAPQIVLAADPASLAYSASNVFVTRFWNEDPVNRQSFSKSDLAKGIVVKMPENEFQRIRFRRDCYSASGWASGGINLIERLSLMQLRGDKTIRIDFYRPRERGAFREREVRKIATVADLLLALVSRHAIGTLQPPIINSRPVLERIIRQVASDLPQREVQVCAGIALGLSSEAIANTLGIGINTVLTYRKRAYARLRISSHNELLWAVYSAAMAIGIESNAQLSWH